MVWSWRLSHRPDPGDGIGGREMSPGSPRSPRLPAYDRPKPSGIPPTRDARPILAAVSTAGRATCGPRHGYAVIKQVEDLSGGTVHLAAGTLYRTRQGRLPQGWTATSLASSRLSLVSSQLRRPPAHVDTGGSVHRLDIVGVRDLQQHLAAGLGRSSALTSTTKNRHGASDIFLVRLPFYNCQPDGAENRPMTRRHLVPDDLQALPPGVTGAGAAERSR